MEFEAHRGDDAEISASATKRPEKLSFIVGAGHDDLTIREHDLCGYEIVQSESKPTDQRSVAAAQREASHADRSDRSGDGGETKGLRRGRKIKSARASRNLRLLLRGDGDAVQSAHVDDDAIAQSTTCPIMASAAHR